MPDVRATLLASSKTAADFTDARFERSPRSCLPPMPHAWERTVMAAALRHSTRVSAPISASTTHARSLGSRRPIRLSSVRARRRLRCGGMPLRRRSAVRRRVRLWSAALPIGADMRIMRYAVVLAALMASCTAAHGRDAGPMSCMWSSGPGATVFACDPQGVRRCDEWASTLSSVAIARCVGFATPPRCASADHCEGVEGPCFCGSESECATGSACLQIGGRPTCVVCAARSDP